MPPRATTVLALALLAAPATAAPAPVFTPKPGMDGKDVIWVPTPDPLIQRMLTMAQVTARDLVVDLGSGDGRTVIAAAKQFGARAVGIEFNPELVELARRGAQQLGLTPARAQFLHADIFKSDFSDATVVTLYLLPNLNRRLRPTLLSMRPGTRVVSHQFAMDDWEPDETSYVEQRVAHLWIVPARVGGGWRVERPGGAFDLDLEQMYQRIRGRAQLADGVRVGLREPRLRGDRIDFTLVDERGATLEFTGRVLADRIVGTVVRDGVSAAWSATRRAD